MLDQRQDSLLISVLSPVQINLHEEEKKSKSFYYQLILSNDLSKQNLSNID